MACDRGHLDDFPFHRYAHDGADSCPGPLRFLDSGTTGSIADLAVRCEATGSRRNLAAAFSERSNAIGPCTARRPWLGLDFVDSQGCRAQPWALLRGASNLYFPIVRSALSVPPWADPINQDLAKYERLLANVTTLDELHVLLRVGNLPELRDYDAEELFEALMRRRGQISSIDVGSLLIPEWQALRHPTRSAGRTDFETEEVNAPDGFEEFIEQVVLVHRLREVRALQGFTRIEPPGAWGDEPDDPARVVPPGRGRPEWLPAIVVRGEGVFIELRHETVRQWTGRPAVQTLLARMSEAQRRWRAERGLDPAPPVDPHYLLAHTLAHLLIRRMSLDAGYSASSLRERIYGSSTDDGTMIGLLVYTASTDSDGSLGGLVELGRPGRLRVLLEGALDEARLCSADPLCSDNEPGTKGMLNGAACHACLLASETSCERGNRLLDRAVLVDTLAAKEAQYFTAEQT